MSAKPLVEEMTGAPSAAPAIGLVDETRPLDNPEKSLEIAVPGAIRRFSLYASQAAFGLIDELDFLTRRSIDQNVFFAPQFVLPAMPRLDERAIRLMVVRDERRLRTRLRFLMPFSVERVGLIGGPQAIRAWTHPFGPLGTPLLDADDPAGTLRSVLSTLTRPELNLPGLLVLPDLRLGEPFAETLLAVAAELDLPVSFAEQTDRAALVREAAGGSVLDALSSKRRRELKRQWRLLEAEGPLVFEEARQPEAVRRALEEFLQLEASGWKGKARTALIADRYRAAFAREAVTRLAEAGRTRIFTLRLSGRAIASLVVFVLNGEAFAWKMGYDETQGAGSPGVQLVALASDALLADPEVTRADSCAVPDHFVMNRLWKGRLQLASAVVGLTPGSEKRVEAAARGLDQVRRTRNRARLIRERVRTMLSLN